MQNTFRTSIPYTTYPFLNAVRGGASIFNLYSKSNPVYYHKISNDNYGYTSIMDMLFAQKSLNKFVHMAYEWSTQKKFVLLTLKTPNKILHLDIK